MTTADDFEIVDNPFLGIFFGEDSVRPPTPSPAPGNPLPTPTSGQDQTFTATVATANVRNTPDIPRAAVTECGRKVSGLADIIGLQEMEDKGIDKQDYLKGLGDKYAILGNSETAIAYRTDKLNVVTHRHATITPGLKGVNPDRGYDYAVLETKAGGRFAFLNTHMHNKAWNLKADAHKVWRKQNWNKLWEAVKHEMNASNMPTFLVGDFNRVTWQTGINNFAWLSGYNGIDKIGLRVDRKRFNVQATNTRRINTPSDHDTLAVTAKLKRLP